MIAQTNDSFAAVVDEFSAAVAGLLPGATPEAADRLARATGNLLMAVSHNATVMAAGVIVPLVERQERLTARIDTLDRRVNGVRQHAADVGQRTDSQIDQLRAEQLEPGQRDELIGVLYQQVTRTTDHEQRITALEQRGGVDAR